MSRKDKYTTEEKHSILMEYYDGTQSISSIISTYGIAKTTFKDWRYKYERYGINGLKESHRCKKYSKELKEQAVRDFLSGQYSQNEIVKKHEISDRSVLRNWINKYNSHIELKNSGKGMRTIMTKGRNTTWKERIEIVEFCIANKLEYQKASEMYKVSYQQVYSWVKKYENGGQDALQDRRGKKKAKEELSPEEKMKLQMKKLEAENQRLRAENLLLKKLDELERRWS